MSKRDKPPKDAVYESLVAEPAFWLNRARKQAKQRVLGKPIHPGLTQDKHPFDLKVGDITLNHTQFLFLWALDRMEQSRLPNERTFDNIGQEMEDMAGGARTYGLNTIYQMSDEMLALGLTTETRIVHKRKDDSEKILTIYGLKPEGHLLLAKIYEQNKSKALVPYAGLDLKAGILQ